jgi:hypothetical protein
MFGNSSNERMNSQANRKKRLNKFEEKTELKNIIKTRNKVKVLRSLQYIYKKHEY